MVSRVFLAEHYAAPVDERRVDAVSRRLEAAAGELQVGFLGAAGLPGDESFLSLFAAPGIGEVARTLERAGLVADRIVPVLWWAGDAAFASRRD